MDWDGIGTFAAFLATGGVGMSIVALRAYKARLAAKLEMARIAAGGGEPESATHEQIQELEDRVRDLTDRLDFTERLIGDGASEPGE